MLSIRNFTVADVPLGMRLITQALWNQLAADWERMLAMQPDGCFVAEQEGDPVGTVMTCIFGDVAWIAMMLVDEKLRGQGIGRALMERALAFVDANGAGSVRLDATPLGRPLYEKLGFAPQYSLARYGGTPLGNSAGDMGGVSTAAVAHHEAIFALDHAVTNTDRRKLLSRLLAEQPAAVSADGNVVRGYLHSRPGSRATQIGPCIADDQAGPLLLADALARRAGQQVFIDIPIIHEPAAALAHQQGLAVQRELLRMCRGASLVEQMDHLWASSGPELG